MSGLAINTASSAIQRQAYRTEYLNELALRAALDQQTYNGTVLYQQTGASPSGPPDMRSVSDKMSAVENNKIALRQALLAITDPTNAQKIVDSLPTLSISQLLGSMPAVVQHIKPLYQYGILAPEFLSYVKNTFLPNLTLVSTPNTGNGELLASFQDFRSQLPTAGDLAGLYHVTSQSIMPEATKAAQLQRIEGYKTVLDELDKFFTDLQKMPPETQATHLRDLNDTAKKIILTRDQVLEMTRDQTTDNALRVRLLPMQRAQQLDEAATA